MSNYYIADLHLGHRNILKYDGRPWNNVRDMNRDIIDRWNDKIGNSDHVYILGDFEMGLRDAEAEEILLKLNGHKHLVRGNHDKKWKRWYKHFDSVDDYLEIYDTVDGRQYCVCMSHYWMPFHKKRYSNTFMLHGHTHVTDEHELEEKMKADMRAKGWRCEAYNVGCMFQDYAPQTLEEIIARQSHSVDFGG